MPKRSSSLHPCNGQCGNVLCVVVCESVSRLYRHTNTDLFECPRCRTEFTKKDNLQRHVHRKHPESAPPKRIVLKNTSWLTTPEWRFLKQMVRNHANEDERRNGTGHDNATVHRIAAQIARRLKDNMCDDFGGSVPLVLRPHGGLFTLSLDRIVDTDKDGYRVHFPDPDNAFANIRIVPLCLNVPSFNKFSMTVQRDVRGAVQRAVRRVVRLGPLLRYESRKRKGKRKGKRTTLYSCCENAVFRDPLARAHFGTAVAMWNWARARLKRIGGRCEISGIPLETNERTTKDRKSPWQMSIDAVDPVRGHVPGNMRIVCRLLNCINSDKKKTYEDPGDGASAWTTKIFRRYFR